MKKVLFLAFVFTNLSLFAQSSERTKISTKSGFAYGVAIGVGSLSIESEEKKLINLSATLPNVKLGYMLNEKNALWIYLPGATFKHHEKSRGFEAFTLASQHWVNKKLWVLGGIGITFDAPVFYEVENPSAEDFNTGFPAITISTGYEIWSKDRFSIDLQYRFFYGTSNLPNDSVRTGIANMIMIGLNWY